MRSPFKSAHFVLVTTLLVGISAGARAEESEGLVEEALADPVVCVSLGDGMLDLRVLADVSDIWSFDANDSVGDSQGEVTLYVATKLPALPVSVRFDKQTDKVRILDGKGEETWLVPTTAGETVMVTIPLVAGKPFELTAMRSTSAKDPFMPGNTNRAVIKQITACPK